MQEGIAAQYDRNAGAYDEAARLNAMAAAHLCAAIPPGAHRDVLDAGCGTGFAALAMAARFPGVRAITGLDASAEMIERFRAKLAGLPGVRAHLAVGDIARDELPPGPFDVVLCSMVLHWLDDRGAAVAAMARCLRPGGILAVVAPGPGHDREYVEVLRSLDPPVPDPVVDVFGRAEVAPAVLERHLVAAGAEPLDVWMELRRRRVPPERYMARIEAVGSHVWAQIMGPAEQEAMLSRIRDAVAAAGGPRGWGYTFTKTYAIARVPGGGGPLSRPSGPRAGASA